MYEERKGLAELKSMENTVARIKDKGSRFVLLRNKDFKKKEKHQVARSLFKGLQNDPSQKFEHKVKPWINN